MDRRALTEALQSYSSDFREEANFVRRFLALLKRDDCYCRSSLEAHLTGSAWIVNQKYDKALLIHHKKLNRWLQPGGHADGIENIYQVAHTEALEETGLSNLTSNGRIFDIDIHLIPARKEVPEHYHYDVRFLFVADEDKPIAKNHESNEIRWIDIHLLNRYTGNEPSIMRMAAKTKAFLVGKS